MRYTQSDVSYRYHITTFLFLFLFCLGVCVCVCVCFSFVSVLPNRPLKKSFKWNVYVSSGHYV